MVQPLWKTVCRFFRILQDSSDSPRTDLPYDPSIPLLGIYPNNVKTPIGKDKQTPVFTVLLFTRAKIWKLSG